MKKKEVKNLSLKILNGLDPSQIPVQINKLEILFCTKKTSQTLNNNYRNKNKPTDVLSFSNIETKNINSWETSLGTLVICLPVLFQQAKEFNVSRSMELLRLLTHGTLHLFGFDHENVPKATSNKMRRKESAIRNNLKSFTKQSFFSR